MPLPSSQEACSNYWPIAQPTGFRLPTFSLLVFLVAGCSDVATFSLKQNSWSVVSNETCAEEWRVEDPRHYCAAQADLDGDGTPDEVQLITEGHGQIGIAATLTSQRSREPIVIFSPREIPQLLQGGRALGVRRVPPGKYETLCGKGLEKCSGTSPREIQIDHDAVLLFKDDSWGDLVYLDSDGTLKLIAHSD